MLRKKVNYHRLALSETSVALELAWRVFLRFEAPDYSEKGTEAFHTCLHNHTFISQLTLYGAFLGDQLVGMIATRNKGNHIALFFVDESVQRQGIGKELFKMALCDSTLGTLTVNSSPFAVKVYEHLGFVATDTEQVVDDIRFTPMLYKGRDL